jgi:hypothetical protein
MTERVYIGDDYCFSSVEDAECFTLSICSLDEYYEREHPEFALVDIYKKENGWTLEMIEDQIKDTEFVSKAVKVYMDLLLASRRNRSINVEHRENKIVEEIKNAVQTTAATCWTLEEASKFSQIGINRLRKESLKKDCTWVLWVGETKRLVKVDAFKEWLNQIWYVD